MERWTKAGWIINVIALLLSGCGRHTTHGASPESGVAVSTTPPAIAAAPIDSPQAQPPSGAPWGVKAGMTYAAARAHLATHGFAPVAFAHTADGTPVGIDLALAKAYPEVAYCTGTGGNTCHFVFQHHASGAYLVVETGGEVDKHPGADIGVDGLFATSARYDTAKDRTDPIDPDIGRDNLLTPTTAWRSNAGVTDDLDQGPDQVSVMGADQSYAFDGSAYIKVLRQRGFHASGFDRADNNDDRVDFVGGQGVDLVRVYFSTSFGYTRQPVIAKLETGGNTYVGDALRDYLATQIGHPLQAKAP